MATTYYASITAVASQLQDVSNAGTTSTASDIIEIRMGNGTYTPSRREIHEALEQFKRWLVQGGVDQAGANLPLPSTASEP